ncbi:MAG: hypothetical protein Q7S19_02670 [bacterium]|nr:hypothetical protein [bacterium]
MSDETTQPEPSANLEPISVSPEQAVSPIEQAPEAPPVAPEALPSTPILAPAQTLVSTPEPQNQPAASASVLIEPLPVTQTVITAPQADPRSFLAKALASIQFRKKAKLDKVLKLAAEKHSITNDQVEKLLHVSDATATRYLAQLVKEERLRKVGPDGRARYEVAG